MVFEDKQRWLYACAASEEDNCTAGALLNFPKRESFACRILANARQLAGPMKFFRRDCCSSIFADRPSLAQLTNQIILVSRENKIPKLIDTRGCWQTLYTDSDLPPRLPVISEASRSPVSLCGASLPAFQATAILADVGLAASIVASTTDSALNTAGVVATLHGAGSDHSKRYDNKALICRRLRSLHRSHSDCRQFFAP